MSLFNRLVAATVPAVPRPLVRHFSRPYIAGDKLSDMVRVVRGLNTEGYLATVDVLGEFIERREQAEAAVGDYLRTLEAISANRLASGVSIKLTAFGLKLDREFCFENARRIVADAAARKAFVRIDMEDSSCTDDTLGIYFRLREEFENVGVVIQACLRRSLADVRRLGRARASVRLCKGIYVEPHPIAYRDREVVNRNFTLLLEELLAAGCHTGIATHDEKLVWEALRLVDGFRGDPRRYEFQILLGVDGELRRIIRDAGHRLRVYVPYGASWYEYSVRRLRENPQVAGYVVQNLMGR